MHVTLLCEVSSCLVLVFVAPKVPLVGFVFFLKIATLAGVRTFYINMPTQTRSQARSAQTADLVTSPRASPPRRMIRS